MARNKKKDPVEKRALQPKTGWDTKADIGARLANSARAPAAPVRQLNRRDLQAAAEGVFQWRRYERDPIRSAAHIASLVRDLRTMGKPFEPLLVFPADGTYFVIDGYHRLAAYEAADRNWSSASSRRASRPSSGSTLTWQWKRFHGSTETCRRSW